MRDVVYIPQLSQVIPSLAEKSQNDYDKMCAQTSKSLKFESTVTQKLPEQKTIVSTVLPLFLKVGRVCVCKTDTSRRSVCDCTSKRSPPIPSASKIWAPWYELSKEMPILLKIFNKPFSSPKRKFFRACAVYRFEFI
jgi:hypothetical protein